MSVTVRVRSSGHELPVEEGETILDAALRHGLAFPYGCRNGLCGSCKGKVLEGAYDYVGEPRGLSDLERSRGYALFCRARPLQDLVIEVREIGSGKDIRVRTLPCRVARMERLAHDVMGLWLKLPATERLQYLAGQYLEVLLRDGRRRSYSIANAPHHDELLELHLRFVPGGAFSEQVFHEMKEKAILRIEGPLGSFCLREDSNRPILLVAGGTGFAPIKAMIEHALAAEVTRPMHLYWGVRALRDLYLDALPRTWAEEHRGFGYTPVLSEPTLEDRWAGRTGLVHAAMAVDYPDLAGHDVYASGPPAMVDAARAACVARGLDLEHFHSDAFTYAVD
jgi:CDP-4-dehydro-6-deoxyglucose reductase, E3